MSDGDVEEGFGQDVEASSKGRRRTNVASPGVMSPVGVVSPYPVTDDGSKNVLIGRRGSKRSNSAKQGVVLVLCAVVCIFLLLAFVPSFYSSEGTDDTPTPPNVPHKPSTTPTKSNTTPSKSNSTPSTQKPSKSSFPREASGPKVRTEAQVGDESDKAEFQDVAIVLGKRGEIKAEFVYAWDMYKKYAWGYDELNPLKKTGKNWFGTGMGSTIIDSLDTLYLMGLDEEFARAVEWVVAFDFETVHKKVSMFETTIRQLGGLLAAHSLSGDVLLLDKARDLARRLLFGFYPNGYSVDGIGRRGGGSVVDDGEGMRPGAHSGTEIGEKVFPWPSIRISGEKVEGEAAPYLGTGQAVLSEIASLQLEFFTVAHELNDSFFARNAMRIIDVLDGKDQPDGIYPVYVSPTSRVDNGRSTLGALGDSYYEYLLKLYIMTGAPKYRRMYLETLEGIVKHMIGTTATVTPLTYVFEISDVNRRTPIQKMDHLVCFFPGVLALGASVDIHQGNISANERDLRLAKEILSTCHEGYRRMNTGIAPEILTFDPKASGNLRSDMKASPGAKHYLLRPETVESYFILYRVTKDPIYRQWGWEAFTAIRKYCRLPSARNPNAAGYAGIRDVTVEYESDIVHDDTQQTFFLAETLKYLFLLFSDEHTDSLSLNDWVFNTEAHPLPIWKDQTPSFVRHLIPTKLT